MEKVIITCSVTGSFAHQDRGDQFAVPTTLEQIADAAFGAYQSGAAVIHVHGPARADQGGGTRLDEEASRKMNLLIRERCGDAILQFGLAGIPLEQRRTLIENPEGRPDMMSVCLTEHDYNFDGLELNFMHPRAEIEEYARLCKAHGVKPEFEVFHLGALYNLEWLEKKGLVEKPYWLSLFFSPKGGVWTPPTVDEVSHRVRYLPPGVVFQACAWAGMRGTADASAQARVLTTCMLLGGHVRVGLEDHERCWWNGQPARSNAELVARIARIANELGRSVATAAEARAMMGLPH